MNFTKNLVVMMIALHIFSISANSEEPLPGQVLGIYGGHAREKGYKIANAPDGGYLLSGRTESFGYGKFEIYDALIIRVDSQGKIVWQKDFGGGGANTPLD